MYELKLESGELTIERSRADFSPLNFSQRYVGVVTEGRIDGAWFMAQDHQTWSKDFDLIYTRCSGPPRPTMKDSTMPGNLWHC